MHRRKDGELPDDVKEISDEKLMALIDKHEPLLRGIIALDVHNPIDAEDVFQETVTKILEHFQKGIEIKYPKAWMVKIAKNKCVDFHRRQQRDINRDLDLAAFISSSAFGGGVSIADEQHQAVIAGEIHNVIAEMKSIYRDVGELHIQGYTDFEISELLEVPEGTVKSRLRKFRQLIREYLEIDTPPKKKNS